MASTSDTSASKNGPDTEAAKTGPGTISDALTAFEAQAAKLPAEPTPDANVAVAYALGWAVGDALTCAKYQVFEHLVKVPELDAPADQWKLLVHQILSRCGHLNNHLESAKADLNLSAELKTAANLLLDPPPGDVKTAVGAKSETAMELHTGILAVLWSVASPLAKSYQLGHEMEQMCATPLAESSTTVSASVPPTNVSVSVKAHNVEVHRLLTALASKLPANAAHATDNSLRLWSASLGAGGEESPEDLLRQGRRWHDVLAGEVSGKDGLRLTDYVAAADSLAGKLWQTARQVAARFKVWLIVAVVFALIGIGLIIWGTRGAISAGIATVLATFGLAWKGIGEFFGRAAAKGEEQLWDAEIDWAIAYRFTVLHNPPAENLLKPRSNALNIDQPTKEHMRRYKQWKKNWPDVLQLHSGYWSHPRGDQAVARAAALDIGSGGGDRTDAGGGNDQPQPAQGSSRGIFRVRSYLRDLLGSAPSNGRSVAIRAAAVGAACVAAAGSGAASVLTGATPALSLMTGRASPSHRLLSASDWRSDARSWMSQVSVRRSSIGPRP